MKKIVAILAGSMALGYLASAQDATPETVVPPTSEWKWLHPADGVDPATADAAFNEKFATLKFDDSKWQSGKDSDAADGGFGYGEPAAAVAWTTPEIPENRKTGYLRHKFTTKTELKDLVISMQRDDGVVIYLDGKEVGRDNVSDGADSYNLMAVKSIAGEAETAVVEIKLTGNLAPGEHMLAISLHNRPGGGSDLRIAAITLKGVPAK